MKSDSCVIRSLLFGLIFFIALTVSRVISDDVISFKTFLPGLAGGLAAGLVIYFGTKLFLKKNNKE